MLQNFVSGTSKIPKIRHFILSLQCIMQRYIIFDSPGTGFEF